ncbi:MAG TPA: hypothetical protein VLA09_05435 [Longimicrobiales bacterium]|nr:hypothetical protein [Longimicrobiales bacterium]
MMGGEALPKGLYAAIGALLIIGLAAGLLRSARSAAAPGLPGPEREPVGAAVAGSVDARTDDVGLERGPGCIRGGTTRAEVLGIMGEPDSIAFGDWLYGRSSVSFGYGVVVDYHADPDGRLVVC